MQKNNPLKIIIFIKTYLPPSHTFIYNDVIGLAKRHIVKVICMERNQNNWFPYDDVNCIPFIQHQWTSKWGAFLNKIKISSRFKNPFFSKELTTIINKFNPDIIHAHFGIQALRLIDNFKTSIPIFITFHGYDASTLILKNPAYRKRLKEVFNLPNIYPLFVSKFLQQNLLKNGITSVNSSISYLGIDTHFFKKQNYHQGDPVFLQVSRFTEKKGHYFTLKAFQLFLNKYPRFSGSLILAGDGPLLNKVKKNASEFGIKNKVIFPGLVNKKEVKNLMENASFFVHHSITDSEGNTEGLPTVIMEAMAMELPILSTFHSGIPELVQNNVNGLLVKEKDLECYANQLKAVLDWAYKTENRKKIEQLFSLESHLKQLEKCYLNVLKKD